MFLEVGVLIWFLKLFFWVLDGCLWLSWLVQLDVQSSVQYYSSSSPSYECALWHFNLTLGFRHYWVSRWPTLCPLLIDWLSPQHLATSTPVNCHKQTQLLTLLFLNITYISNSYLTVLSHYHWDACLSACFLNGRYPRRQKPELSPSLKSGLPILPFKSFFTAFILVHCPSIFPLLTVPTAAMHYLLDPNLILVN